jgi:hypothetical protein
VRRLAILFVLVLAGSACATTKQTIATPIPTLEPMSDFFARLSPRPSVSPPTSPSPSAAARPAPVSGGSSGTSSSSGAPKAAVSSGRVLCPSGQVTAELDDFQATDAGTYKNGDRHYRVDASGTVTNGASASVRAVQLSVLVHANNAHSSTYPLTVSQSIAPSASAPWSGTFDYRAESRPSADESSVTVSGWSWASSSVASCPT